MREILFRGKRDKRYGKGWTYGVPYIDYEGDCIMAADCYKHVVIPETVGQYTGLTDKNGRKIFEGDIVKDVEAQMLGTVVYATASNGFDGMSGFMVDDIDDRLQNFNGFWHLVEVIGNIHDNPELLEGAKENE